VGWLLIAGGKPCCLELGLSTRQPIARCGLGSDCSAWRQATERAVRQLPQQHPCQYKTECGDGVWIMPLGAYVGSRAGGSPAPARGQRI